MSCKHLSWSKALSQRAVPHHEESYLQPQIHDYCRMIPRHSMHYYCKSDQKCKVNSGYFSWQVIALPHSKPKFDAELMAKSQRCFFIFQFNLHSSSITTSSTRSRTTNANLFLFIVSWHFTCQRPNNSLASRKSLIHTIFCSSNMACQMTKVECLPCVNIRLPEVYLRTSIHSNEIARKHGA